MVCRVSGYYELRCGLDLDESCCCSLLRVWHAGLAESCGVVELPLTGSTQLCSEEEARKQTQGRGGRDKFKEWMEVSWE